MEMESIVGDIEALTLLSKRRLRPSTRQTRGQMLTEHSEERPKFVPPGSEQILSYTSSIIKGISYPAAPNF